MSQEKRIIAGYIEQVDRARARAGALEESDLHSIAGELGLSESDLERVDQIADDHLTRGENYLQHDLLDEAISELTLATGLRPLSAGPTLSLAQAHAARWKKEARTSDRAEAITLARRSLTLAPESTEAYALLRSLKEPRATRSILAALIAAMVLLVLLGGGVLLGLRSAPVTPPTVTPTVAPVVTSRPAPPPLGTLSINAIPYASLPDLTIETRVSDLKEYTDATSYKLGSELVNDTDQVIKALTAEISLLTEDGSVLYRRNFDPLGTHHPRIRPGDRHAFYHHVYISPLPEGYATPHTVEIRILKATANPAAASYPEADPLTLHWATQQPGHLSLSLHQRSSIARERTNGGVFHRSEYEIHSTPESGSIEHLKMSIEYLDQSGTVIGTDETYAVASSEPSMLPGSVRLFSFLESLSETPAETRISVIEIR